MKYIYGLMFFCFVSACKEEVHLKHKLAFTKIGSECTSGMWNYKLVSNTNGERYEFNQCLADNYNGAYTVVRRGDTLDVHFTDDTSQVQHALYKMELDVDAWPKYTHIYLGEQLLKVGAK